MTITLHRRRAPWFVRAHATRRSTHDGVIIVEHEFEGGPFDGRRMTGLACIANMHVVRSEVTGEPRLVVGAAPTDCVGTYRFERTYDCMRTVERVHAYRWHSSSIRHRKCIAHRPPPA